MLFVYFGLALLRVRSHSGPCVWPPSFSSEPFSGASFFLLTRHKPPGRVVLLSIFWLRWGACIALGQCRAWMGWECCKPPSWWAVRKVFWGSKSRTLGCFSWALLFIDTGQRPQTWQQHTEVQLQRWFERQKKQSCYSPVSRCHTLSCSFNSCGFHSHNIPFILYKCVT